jgi:Flp pilus assembly protein TadG
VEAALVMPLLLLLIMGLLEFGWVFLRTQHITHAARHGARVGANADATTTDVETVVQAWCQQVNLSDCVVTTDPVEVGGMAPGTILKVTVTAGNINLWETLPLVPAPDTFTSSVTMAKEGPGAVVPPP